MKKIYGLLFCVIMAGIGMLTAGGQTTWENIFNSQRDAVVQVLAYTVDFDWSMPFRRGEMSHGRGSGFVVTPDGEIYTNFHVVNGSEVLFVQFPQTGKERFEVDFLGGCPEYDCARIKLKSVELERYKQLTGASTLQTVALGDSDDLKESQKIMLIGYPLGQENVKSSTGCVSGREEGPRGGGEWITTTTPANPGNSGGPFFDKEGNVVGILVAGIPGANNIAYLIPINNVKKIATECFDGNVVRAPHWGLDIRPVTSATLVAWGIGGNDGVVVVSVGKQSLAEQAGLQPMDVIVNVNGYVVDRFGYLSVPWSKTRVELGDVLARFGKGEYVHFSVIRSGACVDCSVATSFEQPFVVQDKYPTLQEKPDYEVFGGMVFMELTNNHLSLLTPYIHLAVEKRMYHPIMQYLKTDKRVSSRVCVACQFPETDIAKSGALASRDLIVKTVNGISVSTLSEFREAVMHYDKENLFCAFEMESGVQFALSLPDVIMQEPVLAQRYGYEISEVMTNIVSQCIA